MRWLDSWRTEDRYLQLALKIGLVAGALILELIILVSFAYLMWRAAS